MIAERKNTVNMFDEAELLHRVPMFERLEPSKLRLLAFTSQCLTFEDGEALFRVSEPADCVYVITEGQVEYLANTESGEVVAGTLGKNELLGELAVLTNSRRSATVRARGRLEVLCIREEMFVKLLCENSHVALDVMRQLSTKLIRSLRQFEMVQGKLHRYESSQRGGSLKKRADSTSSACPPSIGRYGRSSLVRTPDYQKT